MNVGKKSIATSDWERIYGIMGVCERLMPFKLTM